MTNPISISVPTTPTISIAISGINQVGINFVNGITDVPSDGVYYARRNQAWAALGSMALQVATAVAILGGAIDGTALGATTPSTVRGTTLASTIATGTPPITVASTTLVPNLYVARAVLADSATGASPTGAAGGDLTGTYPSPTVVAARFSIPGAIGNTTPSTGAFTTLSASHNATSLVSPIDGNTLFQAVGVDGSLSRVEIDSYGTGVASVLSGRSARGTQAIPSALKNNDVILRTNSYGYGTTGWSSGSRGSLEVTAAEDWTDTAQGSQIFLRTTAVGTTALATRVTLSDTSALFAVGVTPSADRYVSTVAIGTAPFTVTSTTVVGNLNVSQLLGATWDSPLAIGSTTPAAGTFTSVTNTGLTPTQVTFAGAAGLMSGSPGLIFDSTNSILTVSHNAAALQAAPTQAQLMVGGIDGSGARVVIDTYGSGGSPALMGRIARGTAAAPSAINGDTMLRVEASGFGATVYSTAGRASMQLAATEAWSDTAQGTKIFFQTTVATTTTTATRFTIGSTQVTVDGTVSFVASNTSDASSGSTGSINTLGGIGITKALWAGTNVTWANGLMSGTVTNAATATVTDMVTLNHSSSGTVANSFGTAILFNLADDGGTSRNASRISTFWSVAATATRTSNVTIQLVSSAGALTTTATFAPLATTFDPNTDNTFTTGYGKMGLATSGATTRFYIAQAGNFNSTDYGFSQGAAGSSFVNAKAANTVALCISNVSKVTLSGSALTVASGIPVTISDTTTSTTTAGALLIGTGTAATSVTFGGGNGNIGGTLTVANILSTTGGSGIVSSGRFISSSTTVTTADTTGRCSLWRSAGTYLGSTAGDMMFQTDLVGNRDYLFTAGITTPAVVFKIAGLGDLTASLGNLIFNTVGKGIQIKSGTGTRLGNATLVAGTITVTNTNITANSVIILHLKTAGGTVGNHTYTLSAGASFTINSSNGADTSTISYHILESI